MCNKGSGHTARMYNLYSSVHMPYIIHKVFMIFCFFGFILTPWRLWRCARSSLWRHLINSKCFRTFIFLIVVASWLVVVFSFLLLSLLMSQPNRTLTTIETCAWPIFSPHSLGAFAPQSSCFSQFARLSYISYRAQTQSSHYALLACFCLYCLLLLWLQFSSTLFKHCVHHYHLLITSYAGDAGFFFFVVVFFLFCVVVFMVVVCFWDYF